MTGPMLVSSLGSQTDRFAQILFTSSHSPAIFALELGIIGQLLEKVFILKMPAVKITDLAEVLIEMTAPEVNGEIKMEFIGRRPGEKTYEELLTPDESAYTEERDDMFVLRPFGEKRGDNFRIYSTQTNGRLNKDEIKDYLSEHNLVEAPPAVAN